MNWEELQYDLDQQIDNEASEIEGYADDISTEVSNLEDAKDTIETAIDNINSTLSYIQSNIENLRNIGVDPDDYQDEETEEVKELKRKITALEEEIEKKDDKIETQGIELDMAKSNSEAVKSIIDNFKKWFNALMEIEA